MQQRHIYAPPGTFAQHTACRREPKHITATGGSSREPDRVLQGGYGMRHMLECCPCGARTGWHPTLAEAMQEWGERFGQLDMTLPARRGKVSRLPGRARA